MTAPALTGFTAQTELAPSVFETAATIHVGDAHICGNLITCAESANTGVLFIHGWGGLRSGPHNLLTHLARELGTSGVPSLRFDLRGRGESGGGPATLDTMGDDSLTAAAYLRDRARVKKIIIVGICSGGNVGIGILDRLPEVSGLFLLSVYPFSDGDSFGRDVNRTTHYLGVYFRKLFLPATWRKLVRGEIFFGSIFNVLFGHYKKDAAKQDAETEDPVSPHLKKLAKYRKPMTMVYGEADPDFAASHAYYSSYSDEHDLGIRFINIPDANHNFYSAQWKAEIRRQLLAFIDTTRS